MKENINLSGNEKITFKGLEEKMEEFKIAVQEFDELNKNCRNADMSVDEIRSLEKFTLLQDKIVKLEDYIQAALRNGILIEG